MVIGKVCLEHLREHVNMKSKGGRIESARCAGHHPPGLTVETAAEESKRINRLNIGEPKLLSETVIAMLSKKKDDPAWRFK